MSNDQLQEEQPLLSNYVRNRQMMLPPDSAEMAKFLLEMTEIANNKIMNYKGYYYDPEHNKYVQSSEEAMLSERGLQFARRQFNTFLNKNAALANMNETSLNNFIKAYCRRTRLALLTNLEAYGVKAVSTVDEVKNDITEMAYLVLTRSVGDDGFSRERNLIHEGRKTTEIHQFNDGSGDKGKFKGW